MKNKIQKAIDHGAEVRMKLNAMVWPLKGSQQYYEMIGFESGIVWYQKYLKKLLK